MSNIRRHVPVMLQETLDALQENISVIMDGTYGHGGHTQAILEHIGSIEQIVAVDKDQHMIRKADAFLGEYMEKVCVVQGSYHELERIAKESGHEQFDAIFLDIGVNMDHFKEADRGFSIKQDGPLDMRFDTSHGMTAAQWLAKAKYDELLQARQKWTDFGEKFCDWITKEILQQRKQKVFQTTGDIRAWAKELGINDKKLAVIFQAIRIEINQELDALEKFLQLFPNFLTSKGRCLIMTYHSIEDRMVKYAFKELADAGIGVLVNKKVIAPHRKEVARNKAARSAKLRIFEKN